MKTKKRLKVAERRVDFLVELLNGLLEDRQCRLVWWEDYDRMKGLSDDDQG